MERYVKDEENAGKIKNWMEPGDDKKIEILKKAAGWNGEECGETGEPQRQHSEKSKLNSDLINDSIYSCTSGRIENLMEPGDENKIETMEKYVGLEGEEGGETGASQQQRSGNSKLNTD